MIRHDVANRISTPPIVKLIIKKKFGGEPPPDRESIIPRKGRENSKATETMDATYAFLFPDQG